MAEVADSMKSNIDAKPALMPVLHDLNTPLCHLCEKHGGTMRICRQAGNISAISEKRATNTTNEGLGEERKDKPVNQHGGPPGVPAAAGSERRTGIVVLTAW